LHPDKEVFLASIQSRTRVILTFFSKEDRTQLVRTCAPMDFAPGSRTRDPQSRFHFWDYDSDEKRHTLSLLPEQVVSITGTEQPFDPAEFVTWSPNWTVPRDWGRFS